MLKRIFLLLWITGSVGQLWPQSPVSFHFVVTGDAHMYRYAAGEGKIHLGFKDDLLPHVKSGNVNGPGDFIIVAGDMDPFRRVLSSVRDVMGPDYGFYPVIGNHDVGGTNNHGQDFPEDNWQNAFEIVKYNRDSLKNVVQWGPEVASPGLSGSFEKDGVTYYTYYDSAGIYGAKYTSYSFDHENSHFIVIDEYATNSWGARGEGRIWNGLYEWLKNDLDSTDKENIFVFGHEPLWTSSSLNDAPVSRQEFWDLLKSHHVIAYFCGHVHDYAIADHDSIWEVRPSCAYEYTWKTHYAMIFVDSNVVKLKVYEMQPEGFRMVDARVLKGEGTVEPDNIPPEAVAGKDQTLFDGDGNGTEEVTLDGSGSSDSDGRIVSYAWYEDTVPLGSDPIRKVELPTGEHLIYLVVEDDQGARDTAYVKITVLGTVTKVSLSTRRSHLIIYPNPCLDDVHVVLDGKEKDTTLEVLNNTGRVLLLKRLYGSRKTTLHLGGFAPGVYFIRLTTWLSAVVSRIVLLP